jgi:hypothetical protein
LSQYLKHLRQGFIKNNNKSKFILNCNRITTWDDQSLGFYTGLIEGDGCFSTDRLRITFHLKDRYLADELKSIGFGNIQKPYNGAVDLLIASKRWTTAYCVN